MISDDTGISVEQVQALLHERRMTAWDLVGMAYYHRYEKTVPSGERDRRILQLEGKPDAFGKLITDPIPPYIREFLQL
jgi:hypothetical protein